jgi:hypothetical protein
MSVYTALKHTSEIEKINENVGHYFVEPIGYERDGILTVVVNIVLLGYDVKQSSRWFTVYKRSMLLPFLGV